MPNPPDTKAWIKAVAAHLNLSISALAQRTGVAPSTLTRYVNDRSGTLTIKDATLDAIAGFSGVPKLIMPGTRLPLGMSEAGVVPYRAGESEPLPDWVADAVEKAKAGRNGIDAWIIKDRALDLLGILPGDVVLIDQNRRARAGDVVCVQLTDLVTGNVETVMRHYEPPYVLTYSARMQPARPEAVDDERVIIMGVSIGAIRPRH